MPVHNEALAGDELTTIQFNHEWRRIVASALTYYFRDYETDLGLDNEDLFNSVLVDLYNAEVLGMKPTVYGVLLPANRTRTASSFATVSGSERSHQFTKAKAKITLKNINANMSVNTQTGFFRIRANSGSLAQLDYEAGVGRSDIVAIDAVAIYQGLDTVNPTQLSLEFASSGGATLTCFAVANMLWVIEEYD